LEQSAVSRGEIWTVAGVGDYTGKPRPAVIVQDNRFDATKSVTVCAFTTNPTDVPLARPLIEPNARNGLQEPSRVMVDKVTTVRRLKLGNRVGALDAEDMVRLDRALLVFLGLAGTGLPQREEGRA
jgi:mRNA interferase MazF